MFRKLTLISSILAFAALPALAEEATSETGNAESKVKLEDTKPAAKGETVDVSNAKVKALSGSASKFSLAAALDYQGSSLEKPFSNELPNPDHDPKAPQTELIGSFGLAYRINEMSTLGAGTGVTFVAPMEGFNQTEVSTPYLKYNLTYKFLGLENVSTFKYRYFTGRDRDIGRDMAYTYLHYVAFPIGDSNWTVGADVGATVWTFEKFNEDDHDYGWGATPFVEYAIGDKYSLTTSMTVGGTHYRYQKDKWDLKSDTIFGDFGVNMAITEMINITPKIVYYPDNMKPETTTIALSAILNVL